MSRFLRLCSRNAIKPGSAKAFDVEGHSVLLANVDGKFYAIENRCSHEDSPLSLGCLKGDLISCTLHGSRFSVKTGQPTEEPATEAVATYQLRINQDSIEIKMEN